MAITYYSSRGYGNKNQSNSVLSNPTGITYLSSRGYSETEDKNRGGLIGGIGYLGEKMAVGAVSSIEGISDYVLSGLAKLFGRDDWAEDIIANDWFGDWYSHPEEWFNPSEGWKVAGDVAGGIGTSIPAIGAAIATGGASTGAQFAASFLTSGLGAAGRATKEAYEKTGQLTGKEYGYGALVGATEGGIEALGNILSLGSGAVVKSVSKAIGKETAEAFTRQGIIKTLGASFAGEAFEEGLSEILNPYWQRATYDPSAKNATADEILYSSLVGGLSGLVMGGGGYVIENGANYSKGNKLTLSGADKSVLETSGFFSAYEDMNQSGDELLGQISSIRKSLLESLQKTGGKAVTMQQKRDLGALERGNVAAATKMFVAKRAQNIVDNAETIAQRLTSYGYKTADGKPITFTASEITEGYDVSKPSSIYKALQTNSKLRELAVADATGQLMMDTNQFAKNTLMGEKLASQVDINRFYEQASAEEIRAVSDALKIDNWSGLTPEVFNQKITDFINDGGVDRTIKANERRASFEALQRDAIQRMPKYVSMGQNGMMRYTDGQLDLGIEREGESYRTYNYATKQMSKDLTKDELNGFLRDYDQRREEYAAAERERIESEQKRKNEIAEIDNLARNSVKEYKTLSAPSQSMIRRIFREGRSQGISDSDLAMYARVSAHSGIDIQFDKEATYRGTKEDGSADYADGFYEAAKNRIVVNPEGKRTAERLLIHELDHAIRKYFDSEGKPATRIYFDAIEGVDQETRDKILEAYKKTAKPGEVAATVMDETNAYYAEQVLGNKYTLEKLLEAEPTLKDKILSFFKGASTDYADVPKLAGAAKKYYRTYKKLFDEFSARNAENNAIEKPLTSMNQEDMSVSDRQYADGTTQHYDIKKSFSKQVDDYINHKFPQRDMLIVGGTPELWQKVGFNPLPITIDQTHVDYALNGTKDIDHHIGVALLKDLPNAIREPVAIIQSQSPNHNDRAVAILQMKHNGKSVIGVVEVNGQGIIDNLRIDTNTMTTTFAKTNALTQLETAIKNTLSGKKELFYWNKKEAMSLLQSAGHQLSGSLPQDGFVYSIRENGSFVKPKLKNITESQQFKRWFGKSKAVNADGTPMILYHQTSEDFTVFDPRHKGAGTNDSETPFGIFLKPDDSDIGLKGKKQMALYAKIINPLEVNSRYDLRKTLEKLSPEYAKIMSEETSLATEYKNKIENVSQAQLDYAKKYREDHPGATRSDIYHDSKFKELFDAEEHLVEEWSRKGDELAIRAKEEITKALKENGYDGVHIKNDAGSFGRKVETYIALEPNQVKSATDNIGTYSKYEGDINYALDIGSDSGNISGAEVKPKAKAEPKAKAQPKAKTKAQVRADQVVQNKKIRAEADYTTDKVFSQASVKRNFDKVEAVKKIPASVREDIARRLWIELEMSEGDEIRNSIALGYSIELFQAIRFADFEAYANMSSAQRNEIQTQLRNAVDEIVKSGKESKLSKIKGEIRDTIRAEERVGSEIKSMIYQNLKKIDDRKKRRFLEAAEYKGDVFNKTLDTLTKIDWRGKFSAKIARNEIAKLSEWYTSDNPMFKMEKVGDENSNVRLTTNYSDSVRYMIDSLAEGEGDFTNSELKMLSDVTGYFAKLVDEYDKVYIEGKWQDGEPIAREMIETIKTQDSIGVPIVIRAMRNNILSAGFKTFGDPLSVIKLADMYGEGIYGKYYDEWTGAEISADAEAMRIKAAYDEFMKANPKYLKGAETTKVDLHGKDIRKIDLISYAMTLKRKQAWESIAEGGVVFQRYEKGLFGNQRGVEEVKIYPTSQIEQGRGYQERLERAMTAEYNEVIKLLDEKDLEYMKVLEQGFELARATKAEGDMQRLGFVSVVDGYYYPIKHVDTGHLSEVDLELLAIDRYANASFNKQTTKAKSAIKITSADSTFNSHVKGVSRYLYLSPVMDSFNKLYKLQVNKNTEVSAEQAVKGDNRGGTTTVQRATEESKSAWRHNGKLVGFEYLQNIMLDTMGMGKSVGDDFFAKIRGGSVGFALGANPKVLVTQLSSLISSTSVLSYGSHVGGLAIWSGDMDKYSDVAKLRNSDYTVAKAQGVVDSISTTSKIFSSLIGVMDRFVVYRTWAACQAEVAKNGGPAVGTEENRIKAGKLLDKVILETQQNSLTSRRTEGARRGNILTKSVQMYKSDAITAFGRVIDGWGEMSYINALLKSDKIGDSEKAELRQRYEGAKKGFAKAVGSVAAQALFLLIVNEMFRSFYGKNDDETEEEKQARLLVDLGGNLIGGMPVVSEVYSMFTSNYGFDAMEMSAVNDFFDAIKDVISYTEKSREGTVTDRDTNKLVRTVLYSGGQLLGIPFRNMRNVTYGAVRLFDKNAAYKWDNAVYQKNYSADLTKALESGDMERAMMIAELALGEKIGSGFSEDAIKELASLISSGERVLPSAISNTITVNGEEYVLGGEQYAAVKDVYGGVINAVNGVIDSKLYKSYTDEQKAKVLRKVYSTYKDIAYDTVLGTQRNPEASIISNLLSEDMFSAYLAISAIESDVDALGNTISGSKRAKVVDAIKTLGVRVEERLLLICASGYAIKDGDVRGLSADAAKSRLLKYILKMPGLNADERISLAQMCGFEVKNGRIVNNFSKNLKKLSKK